MAGVFAAELDWDALYADQLPRLYNYFRFRAGTDADAEDLTAHTFERAWRSRERVLGPPLASPAGRSMIELLMEGGCNT